MPPNKLFVSYLPRDIDNESLKTCFQEYGQVVDSIIMKDRQTGLSRCFGFVTFFKEEDTNAAKNALDNTVLHGNRIKVNYAGQHSPIGLVSDNGAFGGSGGHRQSQSGEARG